MEGTIQQILKIFDVPYTEFFLHRTVDTLPYAGSFFGLSTVLSRYGIDNRSVRFSDKDAAKEEATPFVVLHDGRFAVVTGWKNGSVEMLMPDGGRKQEDEAGFMDKWDGTAMLLSSGRDAGEPGYDANRREERTARLKQWLTAGCGVAVTAAAVVSGGLAANGVWWILAAVCVAGLTVAFLLLQKQLHIENRMADRLCGLIHESHCEEVTQSDGADLFGFVKLSEAGAAFFGVNALVLLFFPQALFWMAVAAAAVLPFTFWSVWYQRFRAHSWCVLCLATLALMWIQAAVCLAGGLFRLPSGGWIPAMGLCAAYGLAALLLNRLMHALDEARQSSLWHRRYNDLKAQERVAEAYLADAPRFDTSPEGCSALTFGNPDAPRNLTVFSNPYCAPCAMIHERIKDMPGGDVSVRYVMTYFSDDRSRINRLIIAAYRQLGADAAWELMTRWYAGGKEKGTEFFDGLGLDPDAPEVTAEFEKQNRWRENKDLTGTPAVICNGRMLPEPYGPEDYPYIPKE